MLRLTHYFDIHKYFLSSADSIDAIIEECRLTQVYLGELIELKLVIGKESQSALRAYERKRESYRDIVQDALRKRGVTPTESTVRAKVEFMFGDQLAPLKESRDDLKLESDCANDLYFAMMQRKDILVQIIDRWKFKDEYESCLMKNKEVINRLLRCVT